MEEREEMMSVNAFSKALGEGSGVGSRGGATGSQWSLFSDVSTASRFSLSEREGKLMKRMLIEKDRENNIAIKGLKVNKENVKEEVEKFLLDKLEIEIELELVWFSGPVIIAKLKKKREGGNNEQKKKVSRF